MMALDELDLPDMRSKVISSENLKALSSTSGTYLAEHILTQCIRKDVYSNPSLTHSFTHAHARTYAHRHLGLRIIRLWLVINL
jgi:hypothetical protein